MNSIDQQSSARREDMELQTASSSTRPKRSCLRSYLAGSGTAVLIPVIGLFLSFIGQFLSSLPEQHPSDFNVRYELFVGLAEYNKRAQVVTFSAGECSYRTGPSIDALATTSVCELTTDELNRLYEVMYDSRIDRIRYILFPIRFCCVEGSERLLVTIDGEVYELKKEALGIDYGNGDSGSIFRSVENMIYERFGI